MDGLDHENAHPHVQFVRLCKHLGHYAQEVTWYNERLTHAVLSRRK